MAKAEAADSQLLVTKALGMNLLQLLFVINYRNLQQALQLRLNCVCSCLKHSSGWTNGNTILRQIRDVIKTENL